MSETGGEPVILFDDRFLLHRAAGHPERPERLEAILRGLDADSRLASLPRRGAEPAPDEALLAVHTPAHLKALSAMAAEGGGWLDGDTYCGPHSAEVARLAAGAALGAVDLVAAGGRRSALALTRPPGHHAGPERAMGFCLLNNAALAVRHAQRRHRLGRVAVIDIDVHHGNGTETIFEADPEVLYTSLHQHPFYPGTGAAEDRGVGAGLGTTLNVPLPEGTGSEAWLAALQAIVLPAVERFGPELVVVSAGFDAHASDPLAGLRLEAETYRLAARRIAEVACSRGVGSVWLLEGGYHPPALAASVVASLHGLLEAAAAERAGSTSS